MSYAIVIDGELIEADRLYVHGYLAILDAGRHDWYLAEDDAAVEEAVARYWKDMVRDDTDEFVALVGAENIVGMWASGRTLEDWLEDITPEETFGGDGELDVSDMVEYLMDEYPELSEWISEITSGVDDFSFLDDPEEGQDRENYTDDQDRENYTLEEDELLDDKVRIVELLKGWQEVIDECGFMPTIAYAHN